MSESLHPEPVVPPAADSRGEKAEHAGPSLLDVQAVRDQFPILQKPLPGDRRLAYLDNAATTQKPRRVVDRLSEFYLGRCANVHRGIHYLAEEATEAYEAARQRVQRFLHADSPEQIVFTSGTTMSINLVAHAWGLAHLKAGDEILLTEMEHHSNLVPWQQVARQTGASLRFIPLTADGRLDMDRLPEVLSEKTRLVAVTSMSNVLGTINPLAELTQAAHRVGAVVVVDAAQSVAHEPTDVTALDVDFLAFSGHKVYGPTGIGVLYGRRSLLERMGPFLTGGHMIEEVTREASTWAEIPSRFEAGTPPIVQAVGLAEALDFVEEIGFDAVARHERALLETAHRRLAEIPGVRIIGPAPPHKGAIVSFVIDGIHAHDVAALLDQQGVAVRAGHHCTMPLHDWLDVPATTRASFAVYNTAEDVEALAAAVRYARKKFRLA